MQKFSVKKRQGEIGGSIVNRTQRHGKTEKVPAVSIPVSAIILTEDEFCNIMRDPHAYEAFFTDERSQVMEPRFPGVDIILPWKFEGAKVTITPQDADEALILKPATIGGIVLSCIGAQPFMKCMVSAVPDVHLQTLLLLNKRCTISILNGSLADTDDKQKDLPLAGGGPVVDGDEPPDGPLATLGNGEGDGSPTLHDAKQEEEQATESAIGRQIRAAEAKKRKKAKQRGEAR
jgi:hypothetical protein